MQGMYSIYSSCSNQLYPFNWKCSFTFRPNVDSKVLDSAPGTACMTLAESQRVLNNQNTTLKRLEDVSKDAYSYALAVALSLGGILCLLNAILLLYLCRRQATTAAKQANGADQTATHSEVSRTGSELDFFSGSVDSPRRSNNYSGSSLPRGGRRTLLLQQRDPGNATEPRRFSSSSDGRYVSAPRPDISAEVVPLTSEMSPMRPGSSMSTATIRFRPSGAATTARCHGHHRQQPQQQQQQRSQHHHHHREERLSLTILHNDGSPPDTIRPEQIPAPAPFSQNSPDENPSSFRGANYPNQIR